MKTTRPARDGTSTQHVELVTTSTDTWVEMEGKWLLKETRTDEMSYKIDGDLVAHKGHAVEQ
jgi:hypothetical protein